MPFRRLYFSTDFNPARVLHAHTPLPVPAFLLSTVCAGFPEASQVAFTELPFVDDGRNHLSEARIAQRGTDVIRPPRNDRIFTPLLAAFDTFNPQSVHASHHALRGMRCP